MTVGRRPPVGWYVHHHGAGHVTRFRAVRPHLGGDVVVFSSMPRPADLPARTEWVVLPRDDDATPGPDGLASPGDADPTAGGLLHWAPLGHPGHTSRLATIASWIGEHRPAAFVVDVSAEVTLLVRLLGVPPVTFTQPGERVDGPHRLAFDAAARVVAPWPVGVHRSAAFDLVADRVRHVGGISRFDGRAVRDAARSGPQGGLSVVVLASGGTGGAGSAAEDVAAASAATPDARWTLVGAGGHDWVDDPWSLLVDADVVVTAAGQNSVADLAAVGARAVVVPQDRPFDEQRATGRALAEAGLAVVADAWPSPDAWPDVLRRAAALRPDWDRWQVAGAASRAAAVVEEVASWRR